MATKKKPTTAKKQTAPRSPLERHQAAQKVFEGMRQGLSALKACKAVNLSQSTLNRWMNEDSELAEEYARAREDLLEIVAEQIMEISDEPVPTLANGAVDSGAIQKQKLQVDTRRWLLSKLAPKKWGDKLELSGDKENPLAVTPTMIIIQSGEG
jgi:hypothetical protein